MSLSVCTFILMLPSIFLSCSFALIDMSHAWDCFATSPINAPLILPHFTLLCNNYSMEMDPSAPGYIKLQRTPWLYAILKSTEPYLEEYFNMAPQLQSTLRDIGKCYFFTMLYTDTRTHSSGSVQSHTPASLGQINTQLCGYAVLCCVVLFCHIIYFQRLAIFDLKNVF
jgi:hypothetical protein